MTSFKVIAQNHSSIQITARGIIIGCGILAILLLGILLLQLHGIWLHYPFYITTGGETQFIYGVWKLQEGHPLYTWPNKDFYQLTLYNFASYHLYAGVLNLFHIHGPRIMLYGRFLTVLFAFCGVLIQARLLCFLTKEVMCDTVKVAIFLVSFYTWFNSFFPGYFPISMRADIVAVAVSILGLYCFIRYAASNKTGWIFAAAVLWAATWCLKQADIACIFGAGIYLLASRKWGDLVAMSATFWVPVGLVLLLGSAEYRWNVLVAPTVNKLHLAVGLALYLKGLILSLFSWTFVATLPVFLNRVLRGRSESRLKVAWEHMRPGNAHAPIIALAVVVICGMFPSFIALCKEGSSLNQMFEVFVAATILSFALVFRLVVFLSSSATQRFSWALCLCLLSMCVFPSCQLALHRIGPIVRATDADMVRKEKFSLFLKSQKKPLFIDDEIYSLPWYSSDNRFPAIMLDHVFYDAAIAHGVVSEGVQSLIKSHWIATLYVPLGTPLYRDALAAHYRILSIPSKESSYLDSLGKEHSNCVLLAAP